MGGSISLVLALDDAALDRLAELLGPRLQRRLGSAEPRDDGWLDSRRAAAYLGLTPAALYRRTAERTVPFEQSVPGGKLWFRRDLLDQWRARGI